MGTETALETVYNKEYCYIMVVIIKVFTGINILGESLCANLIRLDMERSL